MTENTSNSSSSPEPQETDAQKLRKELEKEAERPDMNIDYLLNLYKKTYPGDALWMLVQDMNRQAFVWYNVAENKMLKAG